MILRPTNTHSSAIWAHTIITPNWLLFSHAGGIRRWSAISWSSSTLSRAWYGWQRALWYTVRWMAKCGQLTSRPTSRRLSMPLTPMSLLSLPSRFLTFGFDIWEPHSACIYTETPQIRNPNVHRTTGVS